MTIPSARNGISSYMMHFHRKKYLRKAYPFVDSDKAVDLWYGHKASYGRVNSQYELIILDEDNLKSFSLAPDLTAVNFVVDAFEDFRDFISLSAQEGRVSLLNSFLAMVIPKKAFQNPREKRKGLLDAFQESFWRFLENNNKLREIKNVSDYMGFFIRWCQTACRHTPVTLSSFVFSSFFSPLSSGLMIELAETKHDRDSIKYKKFIQDPSFDFYQNAARRFGFRVDYNAPWRMVADVASAEMRQYMQNYNIDSYDSLFRSFYQKADYLDIDSLQSYIFISYNIFVRRYPVTTVPFPSIGVSKKIKQCVVRREKIEWEDFKAKFNNELFWIKLYFRIKSYELDIRWSKDEYQNRIRKAENLFFSLDKASAFLYLREEIFKNM